MTSRPAGCVFGVQVPQYILEDAIASGTAANCHIIITQPRRISALGLATRVAAERAEDVGDTVGYSVRLESKTSVRTRLLFCTTGEWQRTRTTSQVNSLHGQRCCVPG